MSVIISCGILPYYVCAGKKNLYYSVKQKVLKYVIIAAQQINIDITGSKQGSQCHEVSGNQT